MWGKNCEESIINRTKQHFRTSSSNTYNAPYKSISVTAFSNNVTVDGQAIPNGFTVSVSADKNEVISQDTVVEGDDYFVTIVK